jgi:phosphoribosylanthranilate isomerase
MIIKVCGMREQENILQLIESTSPDLMGMIFYGQSSRFVENEQVDFAFYKQLQQTKVGVFVNADLDYVLQKINGFNLDYVQLHGDETVGFIRDIKTVSPIKIIKVFRVGEAIDWEELQAFEAVVDLFLFDTQTQKFGGSGKQFDWSILEKYPFQKEFLLSGGVDEGSIETLQALAVKIPQLLGVDINSKFEIQPGLKDIEKVRSFVKKMRNKAD